MPLKRGLVRESCDFCYRRKVKCDRLSLASQGIATCSQCALRDLECRVKDDSRIRQRNRLISNSRNHNGGLNADSVTRYSSPRSEIPCPAFVPESPVTYATPPRSGHCKAQDEITTALIAPEGLPVDDTFGLSLDNMLFLDQVFLNEGSFDWSMMNNQDGISSGHEIDEQTSNTCSSALQRFQTPDDLGGSSTLTAALHSYFNLAALHLPILVEDAFWQDFYSGRCSPALIYAIACRGMPFTTAENKLDLEQRYASQFRKAFLEARSVHSGNGTVRLDELEALALMVDYDYAENENEDDSALHSNLGALFLTHDALILLMLQNQICDRPSSTTGLEPPPESLANAAQRRMLLYWYIYGLDAFHCLDRKQSSHIHIPNIDKDDKISNIEIRDYFDAMVSLATIAREIIQKLCAISAKRHGVDPKHVHGLYDQLHHWSKTLCPRHLQRNYQENGELNPLDQMPQDEPAQASSGTRITRKQKHTHLRRAVLWALELHCFLQIEAIVADYGIKHDENSLLEADVLAARIEYESIRVLNGMASVCRWINQYEIEDDSGHNKRHSLVDLAPDILRNICAGMCYWSAQRGIELCQRGPSELLRVRHRSTEKDDGGDIRYQIVSTYIKTATLLRETAATAISHNQTKQVLERIDHQLGLVGRHFENLRGVNC